MTEHVSIGLKWLSCLAGGFCELQARISNKIYTDPFKILIILGPFSLLKILFPFRLRPKDISGGGFFDYETNTCIKAKCKISNSKSTKPPPKMSLGISRNERFQTTVEEWT